ncbi:MAG: ATP-binding protein, partial [Polyangiales bacterium]
APTQSGADTKARVVVLDFGLAVDPEQGGVGQTVADDSVSGTPAYMAPEQAAGKAATAASDFYAIGVMLFEALTGRLPFEGRAGEMLAQKQMLQAPSAAEHNPNAPEDLSALCAALLALDPASRPGSGALSERLGVKRGSTEVAASRSSRAPHAVMGLVGRDAELSALRDAYRASCDGDKPVIVLLSGESGIGKSALLERFVSELRDEGRAVVLTGRCYERESVPFKGFDALIDELSRYLRKLGEAARDLLPREAHALRSLFPVLGRIDAIAHAPERAISDPIELQRRGFLALGEMLGRIRDRQPLVIAIDDLQWSDLDSTQLLLHLVRQTDAPRMLLVGSHRSEGMRENPVLTPLYETLEVDARIDVRRLGVGPLPFDAAASLVRNQGDAAQALVREAGGNPFLLGELARTGGATHGRSLAEILSTRVAKLPQVQRALLEVLAVAARPLPLELAAAAADIPELGRAAFDGLRSAQLARSGVQRGSVECYHDRVREAVAAGLGAELTQACHAALAQALVQTSDPDPEHLAEHFEHAGEAQLAAEHAIAAAERAKRAFAFDQAARLYDKALRLGAFEDDRARRLQITLGNALARAGSSPEAAEAYLRACKGASATEVQRLKLKAAQEYGGCGRVARGRELLTEVLQPLGLRMPASPARAAATLALERARLRLRGLEPASCEPDPEHEAELLQLLQVLFSSIAWDFVSGGALNLQLLRRALDAGSAALSAIGLLAEAFTRTFGVGDAAKVPELLQRAQTLIETLANPVLQALQHFFVAYYEMIGRSNGNFEVVLEHSEQYFALTHADLRSFTFTDRVNAQLLRSSALRALGRFTDQTRELSARVEDWQQRNLFFYGCAGGLDLAWLAMGERAKAEREVGRAVQAWLLLENPYTGYDSSLHSARLLLCYDRGDARAAWAHCLAHDERFAASFLSRSSHQTVEVRRHRGLAAATLAAETTDQAEHKWLLREADRASSITRDIRPRQRWLLLVRAAAACARRDHERAVRLLRELDAGPRPPGFDPLRTYAVRRRLGVLLGGDEGKALVTEADTFFRAGGTVDPERLVAALLPGCEIK